MGDNKMHASFFCDRQLDPRLSVAGMDSRMRIAVALRSGLAVCCSVMYVISDADSEVVVAQGVLDRGVRL